MNDLSSLRVSAAAGLLLAAVFSSQNLLAAEPASGPDASETASRSGTALDHPSTLLNEFAEQAHSQRIRGAWWSIGAGAALTGSGLLTAYSGERDPIGHIIWIGGAVSLAGGILDLLRLSELESLQQGSGGQTPGYSQAALESAWKTKAEEARTARHIQGIIDLTLGAGGLSAGALLTGGVGNLSQSNRLEWSVASFASGGFLSLIGALTLARPSNMERDYEQAFPTSSSPKLVDVAVTPVPGGSALQVFGTF